MLLSLNETQTPHLTLAMWVLVMELFPLGFGSCQKHEVAIVPPIDQLRKDRTGPPVPLVSPPRAFSLGLSRQGLLQGCPGLSCPAAKVPPPLGARSPVRGRGRGSASRVGAGFQPPLVPSAVTSVWGHTAVLGVSACIT